MRNNTSRRLQSELHGVLEVGTVVIPYLVRRSKRATHKRIVVQPSHVEVVLPEGQSTTKAHQLMRAKRRWVYEKTREVGSCSDRAPSYLAGSKVRYRGRWLTLEVAAGRRKLGEVEYRSRFYVTLPRGMKREERASATRKLLRVWMDEQLLGDAQSMVRQYSERVGLDACGVMVAPMKRMWASCGKDGVVRLNPDLIELPKVVLEYVMAHEVCHLAHRNHSPAFWGLVGQVMPDYEERKNWLAAYERDWGL